LELCGIEGAAYFLCSARLLLKMRFFYDKWQRGRVKTFYPLAIPHQKSIDASFSVPFATIFIFQKGKAQWENLSHET
ncbi:MAG: hypothetical protein ACRDHZ_22185, partial [Ktedonobacteraceae bacterium]